MACIILKEDVTMTIEEMKQYIMDHMARHKVPKYIDFVDSFPMNAAGKILKYKMRENAIEKYGLQKANSVVTAWLVWLVTSVASIVNKNSSYHF